MNTPADVPAAAGLLRRLAAMLYDGLLLLALLLIATACFLPFTGGTALTWDRFPLPWLLHKLVVVGVFVGFYGVFWTRRGQTLGMASWRLRVERYDSAPLTWRDTLLRLGAAVLSWIPCGLGWAWCVFDREHRTLHDILSRTRVVVLPKGGRRAGSAG
ncbi:MAG TPA: RDD family protein [Steroidobacteraceae bacterium]